MKHTQPRRPAGPRRVAKGNGRHFFPMKNFFTIICVLSRLVPFTHKGRALLVDLNRYRCAQYRQQLAAAKVAAKPMPVVQTAAPTAAIATAPQFWQGASQRKSSLPSSSPTSRGRTE